jgi:cation diffusion facilitator family transporter
VSSKAGQPDPPLPQTEAEGGEAPSSGTRRVILFSFIAQIGETIAIGVAAALTGSSALLAQTFVAAADVAVQTLLVIGVRTSTRKPDASHPLGYGRERYFWSLYAALGIFISGFAVGIEEAVSKGFQPTHLSSVGVGYAVLGVSIALEFVAFRAALRETRERAQTSRRSVAQHLLQTTDPATVTELTGNGIQLCGALLAGLALWLTQTLGNSAPDTIASGIIAVAMIAAAIALTQQNRSLLTGRGVSPQQLGQMQREINAQEGIEGMADLFAVVVGPSKLVVNGDVILEDHLSVDEAEAAIDGAADALRARWPDVGYVYLNPVSKRRRRRGGDAA